MTSTSSISTSTEVIVISSDEQTDSEATICSPTAAEDDQVIVISSDENSDNEDVQQAGSSFLNTILTPEELKLRKPLPETDDSNEYETELRTKALKKFTKKRPIQKSVSQVTVILEKKLKLTF